MRCDVCLCRCVRVRACVLCVGGASGRYYISLCKLVITFLLALARLSWGKQEEGNEMCSGLVWASLASVSHHPELNRRCTLSPHPLLPPSTPLYVSDTKRAGSLHAHTIFHYMEVIQEVTQTSIYRQKTHAWADTYANKLSFTMLMLHLFGLSKLQRSA